MRIKAPGIAFLLITLFAATGSFEEQQLLKRRVKKARDVKDSALKKLCEEKGIKYPASQIFLRAFKQEKELEVWAKEKTTGTFILLKTYPICASSGKPGPKRMEGDRQVPEGFYRIVHFNPESNFYLSLGLNYPNASDKILSDKSKPGGSIYIHGDCVTIGCLPVTMRVSWKFIGSA